MDDPDHGCFIQPHDRGVHHRGDGRNASRLCHEAALAEESIRTKNCDDSLLALRGNDRDLDLALLDVKDSVGRLPLGEDRLVFAVLNDAASLANFGEKSFRIEWWGRLDCHGTGLPASSPQA